MVSSSSRKEGRLIDIDGHGVPLEMFAKNSAAYENDVVGIRIFLAFGTSEACSAVVVPYADDRALVDPLECECLVCNAGHERLQSKENFFTAHLGLDHLIATKIQYEGC